MPQPLNRRAALCLLMLSLVFFKSAGQSASFNAAQMSSASKIQAAILLDVSNSMDGLIEQAKNQLWNMVKVLGKVTCNGTMPSIEIALYEYGRSTNEASKGYVKQITSFTNDLDKLSQSLHGLTTNGGDEFCGHVIKTSLDSLTWDTNNDSYKVIFIAGNESFLQGNILFSEACTKAKQMGVLVNTIFCGSWDNGVDLNWNFGAECGSGTYINIDQNAKEPTILTPYDSTIYVLNENLRTTFVPYGKIPDYDTNIVYDMKDIDKVVGYAVVRADKNLYNRYKWDLVDAMEKDSTIIERISASELPDSLKAMPRKQLKQLVQKRFSEREVIRSEIKRLDKERDLFIAKARAQTETPLTLQSEIEKIIRNQITRYKMKIE